MYLYALRFGFTFHNVSINSSAPAVMATDAALFTFHNVSINSQQTGYRRR